MAHIAGGGGWHHGSRAVPYSGPNLTEHERDAAISLGVACALHRRPAGWSDLCAYERRPLQLIPGAVAYWMPRVVEIDAA